VSQNGSDIGNFQVVNLISNIKAQYWISAIKSSISMPTSAVNITPFKDKGYYCVLSYTKHFYSSELEINDFVTVNVYAFIFGLAFVRTCSA
jgi:hypothetical protein